MRRPTCYNAWLARLRLQGQLLPAAPAAKLGVSTASSTGNGARGNAGSASPNAVQPLTSHGLALKQVMPIVAVVLQLVMPSPMQSARIDKQPHPSLLPARRRTVHLARAARPCGVTGLAKVLAQNQRACHYVLLRLVLAPDQTELVTSSTQNQHQHQHNKRAVSVPAPVPVPAVLPLSTDLTGTTFGCTSTGASPS